MVFVARPVEPFGRASHLSDLKRINDPILIVKQENKKAPEKTEAFNAQNEKQFMNFTNY